MPKTITITGAPFDFRHSAVAVQQFSENGTFLLPDHVAEYVLANKLGKEGGPGAKKRSTKSGKARVKARGAAKAGTGKTRSQPSGTGATKEQIAASAVGDATTASIAGADAAVGGADVSGASGAVVRK